MTAVSASVSTVLNQARALRGALDGLSTALESGDAERVLQAERPLAEAVAACARPAAEVGDAAAVRDELTHAGRLLARCRASGLALGALIEATLSVLGRDGSYDRHGERLVTGSIRRHDLQARG
ncbi:MAG: hypothetical protein AB7U83_20460 [Vicinamibacterales bacterium]